MLSLVSTFRSVLEGDTLNFQFSSDAEITGLVIRWEIIPKGTLPIVIGSNGDFSAATGTKTFTDAGSTFDLDIETLENTRGGPDRDFTIRFYQVDESGTTGGSETLIGEYDFTVTEDDEDTTGSISYSISGIGTANSLVFGSTSDGSAQGGNGGDRYVITRFQGADINILDPFGDNVLIFDFGVEIVSARKIGRGAGRGEITLGTGAVITLNAPANWKYVLGDGSEISWEDFLSQASSGYTVSSFNTTVLGEGNTIETALSGSDGDDVFTFGGDAPLSAYGGNGNDFYVVDRRLSENISFNDPFGDNVVKIDYGVTVTSARKVGRGSGEITLNTGAVVTVRSPADWKYQIANGELISWDDFLTLVSSGYSVPYPNLGPTLSTDDSDYVVTGTVQEDSIGEIAGGEVIATDSDGTILDYTVHAQGTYGTLTLSTDGAWEYALNNKHADVNALNAGDTLTDTITIRVADADGAAVDEDVTITINGRTDISPAIGSRTVTGTSADETLYAGHNISTGGGDDVVIGGYGDDTITLGDGTDTVVYRFASVASNDYRADDGGDTINDFKLGTDRLILADTDDTAVSFAGFISGAEESISISMIGRGNTWTGIEFYWSSAPSNFGGTLRLTINFEDSFSLLEGREKFDVSRKTAAWSTVYKSLNPIGYENLATFFGDGNFVVMDADNLGIDIL